MSNVMLSTAYWPNILYFFYVFNYECVIDRHENYQKQSFRTRTRILSANGVLDLTVPIQHAHKKAPSGEIRIAYDQKWQHQHWNAIVSAYRKSPYFEFFESDVRRFYSEQFEHLFEYNIAQLELVHSLLQISPRYELSNAYMPGSTHNLDLRDKLHPKFFPDLPAALQQPYYQTFSAKYAFIPNLSILDLLFNLGLKSTDYLIN